jgi:hypothetical protein
MTLLHALSRPAGALVLLAGVLMMVTPQANLGLEQLRFLSHFTFPLEALLGAFLAAAGLYLLTLPAPSRS